MFVTCQSVVFDGNKESVEHEELKATGWSSLNIWLLERKQRRQEAPIFGWRIVDWAVIDIMTDISATEGRTLSKATNGSSKWFGATFRILPKLFGTQTLHADSN